MQDGCRQPTHLHAQLGKILQLRSGAPCRPRRCSPAQRSAAKSQRKSCSGGLQRTWSDGATGCATVRCRSGHAHPSDSAVMAPTPLHPLAFFLKMAWQRCRSSAVMGVHPAMPSTVGGRRRGAGGGMSAASRAACADSAGPAEAEACGPSRLGLWGLTEVSLKGSAQDEKGSRQGKTKGDEFIGVGWGPPPQARCRITSAGGRRRERAASAGHSRRASPQGARRRGRALGRGSRRALGSARRSQLRNSMRSARNLNQ